MKVGLLISAPMPSGPGPDPPCTGERSPTHLRPFNGRGTRKGRTGNVDKPSAFLYGGASHLGWAEGIVAEVSQFRRYFIGSTLVAHWNTQGPPGALQSCVTLIVLPWLALRTPRAGPNARAQPWGPSRYITRGHLIE